MVEFYVTGFCRLGAFPDGLAKPDGNWRSPTEPRGQTRKLSNGRGRGAGIYGQAI